MQWSLVLSPFLVDTSLKVLTTSRILFQKCCKIIMLSVSRSYKNALKTSNSLVLVLIADGISNEHPFQTDFYSHPWLRNLFRFNI